MGVALMHGRGSFCIGRGRDIERVVFLRFCLLAFLAFLASFAAGRAVGGALCRSLGALGLTGALRTLLLLARLLRCCLPPAQLGLCLLQALRLFLPPPLLGARVARAHADKDGAALRADAPLQPRRGRPCLGALGAQALVRRRKETAPHHARTGRDDQGRAGGARCRAHMRLVVLNEPVQGRHLSLLGLGRPCLGRPCRGRLFLASTLRGSVAHSPHPQLVDGQPKPAGLLFVDGVLRLGLLLLPRHPRGGELGLRLFFRAQGRLLQLGLCAVDVVLRPLPGLLHGGFVGCGLCGVDRFGVLRAGQVEIHPVFLHPLVVGRDELVAQPAHAALFRQRGGLVHPL